MSKKFRDENPKFKWTMHKTKVAMRKACQRPGQRLPDGKPKYFTEQAHKNQCDVNQIIKKYDKGGLILHVAKMEHKYGDMTANDFAKMQATVLQAKMSFEALPSEVRNRFSNSPELFLKFMEDPENRREAIELGLINPDWTEDTDGLGEHVKSEDERKFKSKEKPAAAPEKGKKNEQPKEQHKAQA